MVGGVVPGGDCCAPRQDLRPPRATSLKGRTQLMGSHSHLVLEMPQGPRGPLCHTPDLPEFWGITGRLGTAGYSRDRSPLLAGGMDASAKDELRENQKNPLLPHTRVWGLGFTPACPCGLPRAGRGPG